MHGPDDGPEQLALGNPGVVLDAVDVVRRDVEEVSGREEEALGGGGVEGLQ